MRRRSWSACPFLLVACACAASRPDMHHDGNLAVRGALELGAQEMSDEGLWRPADDAATIGATFEVRGRASGVGAELGTSLAFDSAGVGGGADAELSIVELYGGARGTLSWLEDRLHPYVACGATLVAVAARLRQGGFVFAEDDDVSLGLYARAGAYWSFGELDVGVDLRSVFGTDVDLAGASGDVDSTRLAVVLGWSR